MTGPFRASERLPPKPLPSSPPSGRRARSESSAGAAVPRRFSAFRWLGRLAGGLMGLLVLLGFLGLVVGYGAYRHFAADLPDVDGLRSSPPGVMSRVYAGDPRPIAEVATERRTFGPSSAVPGLEK